MSFRACEDLVFSIQSFVAPCGRVVAHPSTEAELPLNLPVLTFRSALLDVRSEPTNTWLVHTLGHHWVDLITSMCLCFQPSFAARTVIGWLSCENEVAILVSYQAVLEGMITAISTCIGTGLKS